MTKRGKREKRRGGKRGEKGRGEESCTHPKDIRGDSWTSWLGRCSKMVGCRLHDVGSAFLLILRAAWMSDKWCV